MGKVAVFRLVLLLCVSMCRVSGEKCEKPVKTSCTKHTDCGNYDSTGLACIGKSGKQFCRRCTCRERNQCGIWIGSSQCTCPIHEGIYGDNCECRNATRECNSNPCDNGACVDTVDGYLCICGPGWTGKQCNEAVDSCLPNPCGLGTCINIEGRYECHCPNGYTGNCEGILPTKANLVYGYTSVYASTEGWGGRAEKAVDSNFNTFHGGGNCYHSATGDYNPSWTIQLLQSYTIQRIVITNRNDADGCSKKCTDRLSNITISVSGQVCATYEGPATGILTLSINCDEPNLYGNQVTIQKNGHALTLCEVEIFSFK